MRLASRSALRSARVLFDMLLFMNLGSDVLAVLLTLLALGEVVPPLVALASRLAREALRSSIVMRLAFVVGGVAVLDTLFDSGVRTAGGVGFVLVPPGAGGANWSPFATPGAVGDSGVCACACAPNIMANANVAAAGIERLKIEVM